MGSGISCLRDDALEAADGAGMSPAPAGACTASSAEAYVLADEVHQHTLAGNADILDGRPQRQGRQWQVDVTQRAERRHRDAAGGDHHEADATEPGWGHPRGSSPDTLCPA